MAQQQAAARVVARRRRPAGRLRARFHALWAELHARPFLAPPDLSGEPAWVDGLIDRLPCAACRRHARAYVAAHPPDVRDRSAYFNWGVAYHNDLNRLKGRPAWTPGAARRNVRAAMAAAAAPRREVLLLRCGLAPGDIVTLTAAVRDLCKAHGDRYEVHVATSCPELWAHNPYVASVRGHGDPPPPHARVIDCEYPLIQESNQRQLHFVEGYARHLEATLGVPIPLTAYHGDIHLSGAERGWMNQVAEVFGDAGDFWILTAHGKSDFTNKHWDRDRFQAVVDHFAGRVRFVQVGAREHDHRPLAGGVLDLVGKTDLRQYVRLMYHAVGSLGLVSFHAHLAAAVPSPRPHRRACVVVAGGREPAAWEKYEGHRFIENVGALPCCARGGCWKSRVVALGDGQEHDNNLCERPVPAAADGGRAALPRCMDMITAADVIRAVESYYDGGTLTYRRP